MLDAQWPKGLTGGFTTPMCKDWSSVAELTDCSPVEGPGVDTWKPCLVEECRDRLSCQGHPGVQVTQRLRSRGGIQI